MKTALLAAGMTTMFILSLVTLFIFVSAYLSPAKAVNVHINNYGEANAELLLLSALLPLNIAAAWFASRKITERNKQTDRL